MIKSLVLVSSLAMKVSRVQVVILSVPFFQVIPLDEQRSLLLKEKRVTLTYKRRRKPYKEESSIVLEHRQLLPKEMVGVLYRRR